MFMFAKFSKWSFLSFQNYQSLQEDHTKRVEVCNDLEANLAGVASEKSQLEAEVLMLRDEYKYLKKGMEVMEKFFKLKVLEHESSKSDSAANTPKSVDIEELKQHVFGQIQAPTRQATESVTVAAGAEKAKGKGDSLHEDIMQQSELVLNKLINPHGAAKDLSDHDRLVHWKDVRRSIADKLMTESKENIEPKIDISGKIKSVPAVTDTSVSTIEDSQVSQSSSSTHYPLRVTELVADIQKQTGAPIEVIVDPGNPDSLTLKLLNKKEELSDEALLANLADTDLPDSIKLDLRKVNKDKMEEAYGELRRRRLTMLVQAYTGRNDAEQLITKIKEAQSKINEPPKPSPTSSSIISEALTGHKTEPASSLSAQRKLEAQMIADSQVLAEQSKRIKDKLLAMKDNFSSQREEYLDLPYKGSEVPRVTTPKDRKGSRHGTPPRSSRRDSDDSETSLPGPNIRMKLFNGPKRQIYPHKKDYETSSTWQRKKQEEEDEIKRYEEDLLADWTANPKVKPLNENHSHNQSYDYYPEDNSTLRHHNSRLTTSMIEQEPLRRDSPPQKSLSALHRFRMARKSQNPDDDKAYEEDGHGTYEDQEWDEDCDEDGQTYLDYVRARYQQKGREGEEETHAADMSHQGPTPNKFQKFVAKHRGKAIRRELTENRAQDSSDAPLDMKDLDNWRDRKSPSARDYATSSSLKMSGVEPLQRSTGPTVGTLPSSQTLKYPIEDKTRKFLDEYLRENEVARPKVEPDVNRSLTTHRPDPRISARVGGTGERSDPNVTGEYASLPSSYRTQSVTGYTSESTRPPTADHSEAVRKYDPPQDYRSSSSQGYHTASSQDYRPSSSQGYHAPSSQDYRPSSSQGHHAPSYQDYRPSSSQNYRPSSVQDKLPASSKDYRSASSQDYRSTPNHESKPRDRSPYSSFTDYTKRDPSSASHRQDYRTSSTTPTTTVTPDTNKDRYSPSRHNTSRHNTSLDDRGYSDVEMRTKQAISYPTATDNVKIDIKTVRDSRDTNGREPSASPYKYDGQSSRSYSKDIPLTSSSQSEKISLTAKPSSYRYTDTYTSRYPSSSDSCSATNRVSQPSADTRETAYSRETAREPSSLPRDIAKGRSLSREAPSSRSDSHAAYLSYVTGDIKPDRQDTKADTRTTTTRDTTDQCRSSTPVRTDNIDTSKYSSHVSSAGSSAHPRKQVEDIMSRYTQPDTSRHAARETTATAQPKVENEPDSPRSSEAHPDDQLYSRDIIMTRKLSKDESERGSVSEQDFVVTRGGDILARSSPKLYGSSRDREDRGYVRSGEPREEPKTDCERDIVASDNRRTTDTSYVSSRNYGGSATDGTDRGDGIRWDEPKRYDGTRDTRDWKEPKKYVDSRSASETAAQERQVHFEKSRQEKEARNTNTGPSLSR